MKISIMPICLTWIKMTGEPRRSNPRIFNYSAVGETEGFTFWMMLGADWQLRFRTIPEFLKIGLERVGYFLVFNLNCNWHL